MRMTLQPLLGFTQVLWHLEDDVRSLLVWWWQEGEEGLFAGNCSEASQLFSHLSPCETSVFFL